jgi:hypothetical protein
MAILTVRKAPHYDEDLRQREVVLHGEVIGIVSRGWIRPGGWCWLAGQRGFKTMNEAVAELVRRARANEQV